MLKFGISAILVIIVAAETFNGDSYLSLSRQDKSDKIWKKVVEDKESG